MSSRPREAKKLRKLQKALRRTPPTRIDLIHYLKLRGYAQTSGEARKILTDGRVRVGSHVIGRIEVEDEFHAVPLVPASHREEIIVLEPSS